MSLKERLRKYPLVETTYGFTWGPLELLRGMSDLRYGVCVFVRTKTQNGYIDRQLWVSPTGRSVRLGAKHKIRRHADGSERVE